MTQGAMEGGAAMPMDGRYDARSNGRRCGDAHGCAVCLGRMGVQERLCSR